MNTNNFQSRHIFFIAIVTISFLMITGTIQHHAPEKGVAYADSKVISENTHVGSSPTMLVNESKQLYTAASSGNLKEVYPQCQEWINYTSGTEVTTIIEDGDYLWVGNYGGLTKLNKTTGVMLHYNVANSGLPDNMVFSLAKDINGDLWIGTDWGLTKFDGTNWTVYGSENSPLPVWSVSCIAIDEVGVKWIGDFYSGLVKYDGTDWTIYDSDNSDLPVNDFRSIAIDTQGNKWLGTNGGGLVKFDGGTTWTVYDTTNSCLPGNSVSSIAFDTDGRLWVGFCGGNSSGLIKFDEETCESCGELQNDCIRCIAVDGGSKWVGVHNRGVIQLTDCANWTQYNTYIPGLVAEANLAILIDESSNKWIGGFGGLVKFDGIDWTAYDVGNSGLSYNYNISLAIDDDIKWIGTHFGGLSKFDGTNWTTYLDLPDRHVINIAIDNTGNKWIVTWDGVCKYDGMNWTCYNSNNSELPGGYIQSITTDISGNVWMGVYDYDTDNGGLVKFDGGTTWTVYDTTNSALPSDYISSLATDTVGNVWLNISSQLVKFDGGTTWTVYDTTNSALPSDYISSLATDTVGNVWVGAEPEWVWDGEQYVGIGGGVVKYNGTIWMVYDTSNSDIPSNQVYDLTIGQDGNLWMRSSYAIVKFNGINWTRYHLEDSGLPNRRINSFRIDAGGNIWTATWGGLGKLTELEPPPNDLDCDGVDNLGDNCAANYNPDQEDTYPPQGNSIGDACDCESDFNCDGNVDATDVTSFLDDFGRNQFNDSCTNDAPCNGDFLCDVDVDANDVTKFLEDFGRNQFNNPCPVCAVGAWCVYP